MVEHTVRDWLMRLEEHVIQASTIGSAAVPITNVAMVRETVTATVTVLVTAGVELTTVLLDKVDWIAALQVSNNKHFKSSQKLQKVYTGKHIRM